MLKKKIQYRWNIIRDYLSHKFGRINASAIVGGFFYILLLVVLILNGVTAYQRGIENLQKFDEEQAATDKLLAENQQLRDLYRYYSSIDYKKIYARDNLNLGERGETFYYIEKDQPLDIETLPSNSTQRVVSNISLWSKLLFGV